MTTATVTITVRIAPELHAAKSWWAKALNSLHRCGAKYDPDTKTWTVERTEAVEYLIVGQLGRYYTEV